MQVELHGQYSMQRLKDMGTYMRESSACENAAIFLSTPAPCMMLVTLLDCFKLERPEEGLATSYQFWIRAFCVIIPISVIEIAQLQVTVPVLQLDTKKTTILSLFTWTITLGLSFRLAFLVVCPVSFLFVVGSPVWLIPL